MKLIYPEWNFQVDFDEESIPVLYIENPEYYSMIIGEILNQCKKIEGRFVLSNNNKDISFEKGVDFIFNPFILDLNERKILAKLYQYLETNILEDRFTDKIDLSFQMLSFIERIVNDQDYSITYNQDINTQDLFKLVDLKFDLESEKLVEKLIDYMKVSKKLCRYELFILINLKQFIKKEELEELFKNCIYEKINILLFESHESYNLTKYERKYVIDKDLCDLY